MNLCVALIAQLGERKTEDLEALCSIHSQGNIFVCHLVETIEVFLLGCWLYVFPFLDCVFSGFGNNELPPLRGPWLPIASSRTQIEKEEKQLPTN